MEDKWSEILNTLSNATNGWQLNIHWSLPCWHITTDVQRKKVKLYSWNMKELGNDKLADASSNTFVRGGGEYK